MIRSIVYSTALITLVLGSPLASAKIYKCVEGGKTTFSDKPCGDSAAEVNVEIKNPPPSGSSGGMVSDEMKKLTKELSTDRRKRELKTSIERKQTEIEEMKESFNDKIQALEKDLEQARSDYNRTWSSASIKHKRDDYYDRKNKLKNEISDTRRRHYDNLNQKNNELYNLKKELRTLR